MLEPLVFFFLAAAFAPPLCKQLGLGSLFGYLLVGLAIRPVFEELGVDVEEVRHVSELGVVLLLFLVGLELKPSALWAMRGDILGIGLTQYLASTALIAPLLWWCGAPFAVALVGALAISMSSTALGLRELANRRLMATAPGQAAFSVLLLQDILVVPVLLLIAWLGEGEANAGDRYVVLKGLAVFLGFLLFGRFLARPLFRWVAESGEREPFVALSLGLVTGAAALAEVAGFSMALGTFLAGVLLADSEYRHELELDIEPFKGLLLGLFFMSVGLNLDIGLIGREWLWLSGAALVALLLKGSVLATLARWRGLMNVGGRYFVVALAPIGEFALVLSQKAGEYGVIEAHDAASLNAVTTLTLLAGPLLFTLVDRLGSRRFNRNTAPDLPGPEDRGRVIVSGFGRFGQVVARMLLARGHTVTIIDNDPTHVDLARRFGWKAWYGDASRLDVLRAAGVEQSRLLVLATNDSAEVIATARRVKAAFPKLTILARAHSRVDAFELVDLGVEFERETFRGAVHLAERALEAMGDTRQRALAAARAFIDHDEALLRESASHRHDQDKLIAMAAKSRVQLEELLSREQVASEDPTLTRSASA